jgi:hypothetical protein
VLILEEKWLKWDLCKTRSIKFETFVFSSLTSCSAIHAHTICSPFFSLVFGRRLEKPHYFLVESRENTRSGGVNVWDRLEIHCDQSRQGRPWHCSNNCQSQANRLRLSQTNLKINWLIGCLFSKLKFETRIFEQCKKCRVTFFKRETSYLIIEQFPTFREWKVVIWIFTLPREGVK